MTDELTPQGRFAEIAREDGRGAVVTILEGPGAGAKMLVEPDGTRRGSLGSPELDDEAARHADELMWSERSEQRGNLFVDVTPSVRAAVSYQWVRQKLVDDTTVHNHRVEMTVLFFL